MSPVKILVRPYSKHIYLIITGDQRPVVQLGHGFILHDSLVAGMFVPQYSKANTLPLSIRHDTKRSMCPSPQVTEHYNKQHNKRVDETTNGTYIY